MTTIKAEIILDSVNEYGNRLTTMQLRFPRFILPQLLTHRMFSRNASSSRAIPVERLIQDVLDDTAMPIHWGKNQPGMQAKEEQDEKITFFTSDNLFVPGLTARQSWFMARNQAVNAARSFAVAGYHKQIVNRLLEPFAHINVLVTATEFDNFFELRDHSDAQPEIEMLAKEMKKAINKSMPLLKKAGEWHLPYTDDLGECETETMKKISVARCASVSYKTVDGNLMTAEKALQIFNKLYTAKPFHASPFEHIAVSAKPLVTMDPDYWYSLENGDYILPDVRFGNFNGWIQFRRFLENAEKNAEQNVKINTEFVNNR